MGIFCTAPHHSRTAVYVARPISQGEVASDSVNAAGFRGEGCAEIPGVKYDHFGRLVEHSFLGSVGDYERVSGVQLKREVEGLPSKPPTPSKRKLPRTPARREQTLEESPLSEISAAGVSVPPHGIKSLLNATESLLNATEPPASVAVVDAAVLIAPITPRYIRPYLASTRGIFASLGGANSRVGASRRAAGQATGPRKNRVGHDNG